MGSWPLGAGKGEEKEGKKLKEGKARGKEESVREGRRLEFCGKKKKKV